MREGVRITGALAGARPGDAVETCAILTTVANAALAPIHRRMPVILPPEAFEPWLAGDTAALVPCPQEALSAFRVGPLVNSPGNDDPRCVEPLADG